MSNEIMKHWFFPIPNCSFSNQVDLILCNPPRAQIGLATLVDAASGRIVSEPDSGLPYRLRVLSCDAQGLHPGDFTIIRLKLIELANVVKAQLKVIHLTETV